jgi:hypothetical protein
VEKPDFYKEFKEKQVKKGRHYGGHQDDAWYIEQQGYVNGCDRVWDEVELWKIIIEKDPTMIEKCPTEIYNEIEPTLSDIKNIGII